VATFVGTTSTLTWSESIRRSEHLMQVLEYFLFKSFTFEPSSRLKLMQEFMNDTDRKLFDCDIGQLEWDSFARDITLGMRRHLIGEPDETLARTHATEELANSGAVYWAHRLSHLLRPLLTAG
jgi:hypothetical protein